MKVAIADASVFFDLYKISVLPEFFGLDMEIYTTDFIYNEILRSEERALFETFCRSNQLKIIIIDELEREQISVMDLKYSNSSLADRTAIFKARQMDCNLLTCDNKLKKEAEHLNVEVHGSIWILDQLIDNNVLETGRAIVSFELLKATNAWLPINEIDLRIDRLKKIMLDK